MNNDLRLTIPIKCDSDGFLDRQCPRCKVRFKAHGDDWRALYSDEIVWCPVCGHAGPTTNLAWADDRQRAHVLSQAGAQGGALARNMLVDAFKNTNRPGSSISFSGHKAPMPPIAAVSPTAPISSKFTCSGCGARLAIDVPPQRCPACGADGGAGGF